MRNISALRAFALHPSINTADLSKLPRLVLKNQCHLRNQFVHSYLPLERVERAIRTLQFESTNCVNRRNELKSMRPDYQVIKFILLLFFSKPMSLQGFRSIVCVFGYLVYSFMHLYNYCFEQDFLSWIFN